VRHRRLALLFGIGIFALHIATAGRYGYHRDELYFIACARHLAWGYVDQPPMIAVIARITCALFGKSLYALRVFPALAAALIVMTTGLLARRLGGGLTAQGFAMLAAAVAPFYLAVGNLLTMNAFEPLFWMVTAYILIDILDGRTDRHRWFTIGAVVAFGILTKYTMVFFALSLCAALFLSPERKILADKGFMAALAVATVLVAPNVLWQYTHAWPQFALLHDAMLHKDLELGPLAFGLQQALMVNPLTFPLWAAGLFFFLRGNGGRYRVFFWSYALLFVVYVALRAKVYYLAAIYPILFAGGACASEPWLMQGVTRRRAYAAALITVGAIILPQVIPVLSLPHFLAYQKMVDFRQIKGYKHEIGLLPEQYADMAGWERLTAQIASVYQALPPAQRTHTAIWTNNYGEAAAVDLLGERLGLPKAISGHNSYYLWGTHGYDGSSVITVGMPATLTHAEFGTVRRVSTFTDPYVLPNQSNLPIELCMHPKIPLAAFWPHAKAYW
jgi:Dolichyl-phosphate-mannose-protein mannosyltransferase